MPEPTPFPRSRGKFKEPLGLALGALSLIRAPLSLAVGQIESPNRSVIATSSHGQPPGSAVTTPMRSGVEQSR